MKKTLFLAAALCVAGVAQAEYHEWDSSQTDGGSYTLQEDTTFNVIGTDTTVTLRTVLPSGYNTSDKTLTKKGTGTLKAQLNVAAEDNPFTGSINVQEGVLELSGGSSIGAGTGTTVTVAKGAQLDLIGKTGISIPGGNKNPETGATATVIRNDGYALPYGGSTLRNVVVETSGIEAADSAGGARGLVIATEVALTDLTVSAPAHIANTDIYSEAFSVTGHSTVDNATVHATTYLYQPLTTEEHSLKVTNGSRLILDNENGGRAGYGSLMNTTVDKTSFINSGDTNGKLIDNGSTTSMAYIQLRKGNELAIASKENGGVAVRQERVTPAAADGELPSLEVVYVTEQLSGCKIDTASTLKVTLEDTVLSNPEDYDSFTFTVVLKGLDSHDVLSAIKGKDAEVVSGKFYTMGKNSPVWLELPKDYDTTKFEYNSAVTIASFTNYVQDDVEQGPATVFRFLANRTPEPATATLSLLALAGLAARRRRH